MADRRATRVLNVNDDDAARYVITRILKKAGYDVTEAATGRQALYVAASNPDVVVLDVNLPDMDGIEVCRRLRDNPKTTGLRVLHLSAVRTKVADRVEGLETGADAYLTQPVSPEELLATVKTLVRARATELAAREEADEWQATFDSITDAVALLDEKGIVARCNLAFAALHRRPLAQVVGVASSELAQSGVGRSGEATLRRMTQRRVRNMTEVEIDGQWFRVTEDPVFDGTGSVTGAVQIYANITDAKGASEALRESEERFRLLIGGVRDYAIYMLDPQARVASWNEGAERILGYQSSEILGQHFSCCYPAEALRRGEHMRELERSQIEGPAQVEGWRVRKDGSRFWADSTITAVRDENDALRGYATVVRDITEKKMLLEELQHRAGALTEADRRKDEFLAMLGHELRNPLAAIQTALALQEEIDGPSGASAKQRATIARQAKHLARLVDDLLDVSRITHGLIGLNKETIDARIAVDRVLDSCKALIAARQHRVTASVSAERLVIEADLTRLEQILTNLISNAAKYMEPGGEIHISAEREGSYARFRVKDRGIGIAPKDLPRLFDLFAQVDVPLDRSKGGLGIGLTIVKSLVELHGGNVAAYSEGLGLGSEFVVRLPLAQEASMPEPRPEEPAAAPVQRGASRKRRVLIVEDNVDGREAMESLLQFWGHDVVSAPDGETGLQQALSLLPDIVLIDIGLPGMSGYDVARKLRSVPAGTNLYLVAMTGYGTNDDKTRALEAGFNVHLVKPVDADELSRLLNELWQVRPV